MPRAEIYSNYRALLDITAVGMLATRSLHALGAQTASIDLFIVHVNIIAFTTATAELRLHLSSVCLYSRHHPPPGGPTIPP